MAKFTLPINSIVKPGKTYFPEKTLGKEITVELYRYDPVSNENPRLDRYFLNRELFGRMALVVLIYILTV